MADEDANDLERKRQEREAAEAAEESNGGGRSIEARAANGEAETGEEDDGQLFVVESGRKVTLSTLYGRGTPVEIEFKLGSKGVKGGQDTGLISFMDPDLVLIVPGRAGKVEVDPTYNPDGTVKKVVLRPHVKPVSAYDSRSDAGRALLGLPPLEEAATG